MYRSGPVNPSFTHANMSRGPLFGDCHGFMPPQLKTNNKMLLKKISHPIVITAGSLKSAFPTISPWPVFEVMSPPELSPQNPNQ